MIQILYDRHENHFEKAHLHEYSQIHKYYPPLKCFEIDITLGPSTCRLVQFDPDIRWPAKVRAGLPALVSNFGCSRFRVAVKQELQFRQAGFLSLLIHKFMPSGVYNSNAFMAPCH